jgi:alkaline phosphatase D
MYTLLPVLFVVVVIFGCAKDEEIGEFAPDDAYLEGETHPYYGSENAWNRRFFYDQIDFEYKRRGQRQMLDIVEGRPREAISYCNELLTEDANDLESWYNLTVALCRIGEVDSAFQTMQIALAKGLPFERFAAGPRSLLRPLTRTAEFKNMVRRANIQLLHGPMLGCVTARSAKFWIRTFDEVPVRIVVSVSDKLSRPRRSSTVTTAADRDFTAIIEVEGLRPSTKYYYDVLIQGKSTLGPNFPSFRTYPSAEDGGQFKIGFGGGAGYYPPNERIWDVILNREADAFFGLGDNVYINMPEEPNGVHYYTYYRRQSRPEFRRMAASTAIYAIWDDHDAATDDVWLGPYKEKPPWKLPLLDFFKQNWINPGYGSSEWPGCWFNFSIADVDFFMLDGRFYRTNPYGENPTMLGPAQKNWLLENLQRSEGTFKVIASPVPWSLATKGAARDTWNGFKEERREIFDFLAEHKIEGVLLLSADRHRSDAWKIERENGYPLYEFESSRLTNQHVHELMPQALFGYNEKQSFGLLSFDTAKEDPTVTYQIVSIDNEIIHELTIAKSEISH